MRESKQVQVDVDVVLRCAECGNELDGHAESRWDGLNVYAEKCRECCPDSTDSTTDTKEE